MLRIISIYASVPLSRFGLPDIYLSATTYSSNGPKQPCLLHTSVTRPTGLMAGPFSYGRKQLNMARDGCPEMHYAMLMQLLYYKVIIVVRHLDHLHLIYMLYRPVDCDHGVSWTHKILTGCLEPVEDTHERSGPDPWINHKSYPEQARLTTDGVL